MHKLTRLFILFITTAQISLAQNNTPCSSPEASQFDFWLGHWDLSWSDTMKGHNHITRELGACTIHEKFTDPKGKFYGESWSVYNAQKKKWQQTWVDNTGAYMVFEGGMKDGKMELSMEKKDKAGKSIQMSMLFYNISANDFDWDWRKSEDDGKTWQTQWKIHYKRSTMFDFDNMRSYYFIMLKKGPNRAQGEAEAGKIQMAHLQHLYQMYSSGKIAMVGPLTDDDDIAGICVYNTTNAEEALKLASDDPAVKSGRLIVELHPWYSLPGMALPDKKE